MPPLPDVRSIAVLRANGIGDLMFALPALDAIRAAYPAAHVALLATPWHEAFWAERPGPIDEVMVVPISRGVREEPDRTSDAADLEDFFARARARRFDLAIQLHGGGAHSNPFVARLGARTTAGLRAAGAPASSARSPTATTSPRSCVCSRSRRRSARPPSRSNRSIRATPADERRRGRRGAGFRATAGGRSPGRRRPSPALADRGVSRRSARRWRPRAPTWS